MNNKISDKILRIFPAILVLYEIANYLSNDAYLSAMPSIASDMQTSNHLVQLTLTAFFLGNASMQLILGPISDRYGRRFLLLCGGLVFITSTLLCALTSNIYYFIVLRFFQGSAVVSLIITGYATIHSLYDQNRAIKTLAWMNSVTVLAPALGPLFGAIILSVANWRWIFIILTIWAAVCLLALKRFMPETSEMISISPKKIIQQYCSVIKNWQFVKPMLTLSLLFAAMIAWIAAGPFLITETFHYSVLVFGVLQCFVFGSFILGTRLVRRLVDQFSIEKLTKLSISLALFGSLLSLVLSLIAHDYLIDIILPMMIFALGSGIGFPIFNRLSIEGSNQPMGIKMAVFTSFMGISGFTASLIISTFYDNTLLSFSYILTMFACWLLFLL